MHRQTSVKSDSSVSDSKGRLEKAMTKPILEPHLHAAPSATAQMIVCRWRLTFPGVVSQNGASPHLLALDGLAGARLRARGPGRPVAEHAVSRARHLAGHGLWSCRRRAEIPVHRLT